MTERHLETGFLREVDFEGGFIRGRGDLIFESIPVYETIKNQQKPFRITDRNDILRYLSEAIAYDGIKIDPTIFCIMNIADYYIDSTFKTLVFCEDGQVFKSKESSAYLMNRHFDELGLSYDFMRTFYLTLSGEDRHCLPYVLGKYGYLPLQGPCKKSVSWINLTLLKQYHRSFGAPTELELLFSSFHRLNLPIRFEEFEKKINAARLMYDYQRSGLFRFGDMFDMDIREKKSKQANWQRNTSYLYQTTAGLDDFFKRWILRHWKHYCHRYPNKSHPTFQKIAQFLERRFSN